MVSFLGGAVFLLVAAAPLAAQAQANCEPACAAGQTCVNGVCMVPAQPAAPAYAPPPQQPAYAAPAQQQPAYAPPAGYSAPPAPYGAPPAGYGAQPSYGYPPPPPAPPSPSRSGFQALPFIGINHPFGKTGEGTTTGFRIGTLLGGRLNDSLSLNGEILIDPINFKGQTTASETWVDLAFSPLFHAVGRDVEVVVGPKLGFFAGGGDGYADPVNGDKQSFTGVVAGINAGLFARVGSSALLGGMLNVQFRKITNYCVTPGGVEVCGEPRDVITPPPGEPPVDLNAFRFFGLSLAALL